MEEELQTQSTQGKKEKEIFEESSIVVLLNQAYWCFNLRIYEA
jgi:hypothetical protein